VAVVRLLHASDAVRAVVTDIDTGTGTGPVGRDRNGESGARFVGDVGGLGAKIVLTLGD
jgi:hypothetical protein